MFDYDVNLETENCEIILRNERTYVPNSADKKHTFDKEFFFFGEKDEDYISSKHSVFVNTRNGESYSCILMAGGGATGISEDSAFTHDDELVVAVGNIVCCLLLPKLDLLWQTEVDWATCFGIFHSVKHQCYISHGELDIARLSYTGEIIWQASGADIFTGTFTLNDDFIEAVDWNETHYRIGIENGNCKITE